MFYILDRGRLFRRIRVNADTTWPVEIVDLGQGMPRIDESVRARTTPLAAPVSIEGTVLRMHDWPRHIFDFEYDGKMCLCFILPWVLLTQQFKVGQRVRMTGEWSATIRDLFDAVDAECADGT